MNLCSPLLSLSFAMNHSVEVGLKGVANEEACVALESERQGQRPRPRQRRPTPDECEVVMFNQCWSDEELGFKSGTTGRVHEGQTVIVMGPQGDACVYFGTEHVYTIKQPNRRFFLDVAAQRLEGVQAAIAYEGRDNEVTESVEYRFEAELSRLEVVARREPGKTPAIAKLLALYAERFNRISDGTWA